MISSKLEESIKHHMIAYFILIVGFKKTYPTVFEFALSLYMSNKLSQENSWFIRGNITSLSAGGIIAMGGTVWGTLHWEEFTAGEKTILIILVISFVTLIGIIYYYFVGREKKDFGSLKEQLDLINNKLESVEESRRYDNWDQVQPRIRELIKENFGSIEEQLDLISKKLESVEEPRRYDNWNQVQPRIRELISNSFIHSELTELQCVGVALHVSWKTVRECLKIHMEKYKSYPNVKIYLKVLRKENAHWEKMGTDWKRRNNSFYDSAELFCNKIKGIPNVSLFIYDYEYTPNWHGVLINRCHLFRSSCLYRNNEFTVHENPYVYFLSGANNYSDMQIDEFQYWFQFESREIIKN